MSGAAEQVRQSWDRARTRWTGAAADAFYAEYILRLEESAQTMDAAALELRDTAAALSEGLSAIEMSLID